MELRGLGVEPRGIRCGTEGCVEIRGFLLNRGVFGVELRGFWCRTE